MSEIIAFCDGGCRNNQDENNVGGWGVVLQYGKHERELYGGKRNTTNNQMELTGAIEALNAIHTTNIPVSMHCDSAYVVNGMNQWVEGWKKKGWKKGDGKNPENLELWKELYQLSNNQENIKWVKVRGHAGNELNELADTLANKGMDEVEENG
jgi:ribonuclease HI